MSEGTFSHIAGPLFVHVHILTKSMSVAVVVTKVEPTGSYSDTVTSYKVGVNFGAWMLASVIVILTRAYPCLCGVPTCDA